VKYGLYYLRAAMEGKTFQAGPTDHNSVITDFQGSPMDLLPAHIVTATNAADPSLWGNSGH
jgi:ribose transport system substrate-binding protein